MVNNLIYTIKPEQHNEADLKALLEQHPEIKFVSLAGIDLVGHETEEKIPIKAFLNDITKFLEDVAIQTDGSSVYLPHIATIDNAKIDMKADLARIWFVDYNFENIDSLTKLPVGTLKIPCFLFHDGIAVCSRHILLNAVNYFEKQTLHLIEASDHFTNDFGFGANEINQLSITAATELEFWVRTPGDKREIDELSTSQELHEQYWAATRGTVRTALEQTLDCLDKYGFEPEMGHKEVGGVKANLSSAGALSGIMEQLEIDWKYSSVLQAADNELMIKKIIKEVFRKNGMDVTFLAKPIPNVAGSGEHTHISVSAKLQSGELTNLLNPNQNTFLSTFGYGALMGMLKNYEVIDPFITASNEAFKRLKKGFEAPICIVASLGLDIKTPSRNRTVLLGLIRDEDNPMSTRFELRSPNPHTNTFLCITSMLLSMLDGIEYALQHNKSEHQLLEELSKAPGQAADYLETSRAYRSEKSIFDYYTDEERVMYFGQSPQTVYENLQSFECYPEKLSVLKKGNVLSDKLLYSYQSAHLNKWVTEIEHRILPALFKELIEMKKIHNPNDTNDLNISNWNKIVQLKKQIAQDSHDKKSLFTEIKEAIHTSNYQLVSDLQKEIHTQMEKLKALYALYSNNIID